MKPDNPGHDSQIPLSIVIVNYNARDFLHDCLSALHAATLPRHHEIIIIDNKSEDGSVAYVKKHFPHVHIIENESNVGYAKANNQGIQHARGTSILLLNPDTVIAQESIEHMLQYADHYGDVGIIGCRVIDPSGMIQRDSCGSCFTPWSLFLKETGLEKLPPCHLFGKRLIRDWDRNSTRAVDWVSGVCLLVKKECLDAIGLLDERFFAYMEDMDLCRRARAKKWRVVFLHNANITHRVSSSWQQATIRQLCISLTSEKKYLQKHYGFFGSVSFYLVHFIGSILRVVVHFLFKNHIKVQHHLHILKWLFQKKF